MPGQLANKTEINAEPACPAGMVLKNEVEHLKTSDAKQWQLIEKIQNRPPLWATFSITAAMSIIGILIGYLAKG